jgi:phenylalanyl-tRNA synthetase beta chain
MKKSLEVQEIVEEIKDMLEDVVNPADTIIEIGLTPNRSDATGHLGVAFDIAAAIQPAVIQILDNGMKQASSNIVTRGTTVI